MKSCVAIVPAALRAGDGPNNYSVPLSPTGAEPVTHYGLHGWVSGRFGA